MTMKKHTENLPLPAHELETLAAHYDAHDTTSDMQRGEWVDPRPMKTTSLRLPSEVVDALKALAQTRGVRYTTLVREIIEYAIKGVRLAESEEITQINERLARIEAAVIERYAQRPDLAEPKKAAKRNPVKRRQAAPERNAKHKGRASA